MQNDINEGESLILRMNPRGIIESSFRKLAEQLEDFGLISTSNGLPIVPVHRLLLLLARLGRQEDLRWGTYHRALEVLCTLLE